MKGETRECPGVAGLLVLPVVLGPACTDSGGTGLEGLFVDGAALEPARESHPYSDTLSVSGGQPPFEWDVGLLGGNLPPGLRLSADGEISGIPESQGTWEFTVRVRSADGKGAWESLSLTVWPERAPVLDPTESCSDYPGWAVATFEDPRLEEAIGGPTRLRGLGLSNNRVTEIAPLGELPDLFGLDLAGNGLDDISSLGGASGFPSLRSLDLSNNGITDVSPLAQRTTLTPLLLAGNSLADLEALRGLTNLTTLLLAENSLSDLEPLRDMTDLTVLDLGRNSLSDIDPLGGLTDIRSLELNDNRITDLRALAGLTGLAYLDLSGNTELSDIQPLLDNPGLPVHTPWVDGFDLSNTSVPCDDIAALEDRGVFVRSDCP